MLSVIQMYKHAHRLYRTSIYQNDNITEAEIQFINRKKKLEEFNIEKKYYKFVKIRNPKIASI